MCCGCVATSQDLRDLADTMRAGVEENRDNGLTFADSLETLADDLDERTEVATGGLEALQTGGLAGLITTALGTYYAVNRRRDGRRKAGTAQKDERTERELLAQLEAKVGGPPRVAG